MRHPEKHQVGQQPDAETDRQVEQRAADGDERQDLEGEDHLLHKAGMGKNQPGRPVDAVGEQVEHHQAGEKDQGEFGLRITGCLPAGLEDHAEDEGIHGEHEQRMEKRPKNTEKRSPVAAHHLPLHRFPDQVAVAPAAGDHFLWGERKRLHNIRSLAGKDTLASTQSLRLFLTSSRPGMKKEPEG